MVVGIDPAVFFDPITTLLKFENAEGWSINMFYFKKEHHGSN